MFIFLDESGDLGFNFENKGTPRYFIITLLVCEKDAALQLKTAVKRALKNGSSAKSVGLRRLIKPTKLMIQRYLQAFHRLKTIRFSDSEFCFVV